MILLQHQFYFSYYLLLHPGLWRALRQDNLDCLLDFQGLDKSIGEGEGWRWRGRGVAMERERVRVLLLSAVSPITLIQSSFRRRQWVIGFELHPWLHNSLSFKGIWGFHCVRVCTLKKKISIYEKSLSCLYPLVSETGRRL